MTADEPLAALARIWRSPPPSTPRCELCANEIEDDHSHIVELLKRTLMCACRPCHLLFTSEGAGEGRFRSVLDDWRMLTPPIDPDRWRMLDLPVGTAFLLRSSAAGGQLIAFYPSPAGATESLLSLDAWDALAEERPELRAVRVDIEALLVRSDRAGAMRFYIVPVDACYELVGRVRETWRGFDGGTEGRAAIDRFFETVEARCLRSAR